MLVVWTWSRNGPLAVTIVRPSVRSIYLAIKADVCGQLKYFKSSTKTGLVDITRNLGFSLQLLFCAFKSRGISQWFGELGIKKKSKSTLVIGTFECVSFLEK